jgi:hypothetical protein
MATPNEHARHAVDPDQMFCGEMSRWTTERLASSDARAACSRTLAMLAMRG